MTGTDKEYTDTERLIISYIRSHPPEECMLDKITQGTSRSRATVLKYLDILNVKGILEYRFVGRSKLWSLSKTSKEELSLSPMVKEGSDVTINELANVASKLHKLISQELGLKKSIDDPDTIVFTLNRNYDIVAFNDTFETFFNYKNNLIDLVNPQEMIIITDALNSIKAKKAITLEVDFLEKSEIYRPYEITIQSIVDGNEKNNGAVIIGKELSQSKRTKRDLQTLLSITRSTNSHENRDKIFQNVLKGINDLIPSEYCGIFLKNGEKLHIHSQMVTNLKTINWKSNIEDFINKSMDSLETLSSSNIDYYLKKNTHHLKKDLSSLIIVTPIISEDLALGAIVLLTSHKMVNAVHIENVEIAADEISRYITIEKLTQEKNEYINTLVAMNNISNVLNSTVMEKEILEKSVSTTIHSLGFEMGCIYLTDDNEELALKVHKNLPPNLQNMCIAGVFKDLFKKTLENRDLVYITSDSDDYNYIDPVIRNNDVKTLLILPIVSGDKIIGLLNMGSRNVKSYNQTSLENLSAIGLQLGLALEKSKLALKN